MGMCMNRHCICQDKGQDLQIWLLQERSNNNSFVVVFSVGIEKSRLIAGAQLCAPPTARQLGNMSLLEDSRDNRLTNTHGPACIGFGKLLKDIFPKPARYLSTELETMPSA